MAGADASRVVHDLNRMFVHHNVDDMWEVIAARCSATGYVDPGGVCLIVNETSLDEVMGGRTTLRVMLTHSKHTLTLTP